MKSKRTKACGIAVSVKRAVYERDRGRCVFCGRQGDPVAHYVPRSHGGLGIEENIITACCRCHMLMDGTTERKRMLKRAREHLDIFYPDFPDENRKYRRR